MSIRTRNIHFTNWAKVIEALADKGVTVADESAARTFLTDTSSDANPYYYYVGYIKDTQEIYTHGKFYKGSDSLYDDTELRDLIGIKADLSALEALSAEVEENEEVTAAALTELHENKADKSEIPDVSVFATKDELNTLSAEVDNKVDSETFTTLSETVAGHTTSINNLSNNKADKTELEDYATTVDLNTKQDLLVSGTNIKTVNNNSLLGSGNIETPDTKVTSAANHYGYNSDNATSTTGAFVTKITKDAANHVTSFESRALTATDIPSLDASKITSGTISIERLPAGALERMFVVESETAAMSATVQEGDVVQVTGNDNKMYFCISNTAITFTTKFKEFTAGTATSVPWSGVTGKPDLATQEEIDVVDAKFDNYQLKITSSNKIAYSLISGTPDLSVYFLKSSFTKANIKSTLGISDWALASVKPTYTASEVGALSVYGGTVSGSITANSFIGSLTGNADTATKLNNYYSSRPTSADVPITGDGSLLHFKATGSMTTSKPNGDGHIIHLNWDGSNGYDAQLFLPTGGNTTEVVQYRTQKATTWGSWKTLIDSSNYSNYALPITGGTVTGQITSDAIENFVAKGTDYSLYFGIGTGQVNRGIYDLTNNHWWIYRSDSTDTYIPNGNLAIGGTTASEKLHVYGNVVSSGTVSATGKMYAPDFVTTSDNRLKDFVSDIYIDFESLKQIPKKYYYWKDKSMGEDLQLGTSAQELAKIYPECVSYDEKEDKYSVSYQKLSIVALAAIDKLYDEIKELKSKLND